MKKTVIFLATALILAGCTTVRKDITKDPRFYNTISTKYQLTDDFVVLKYPGNNELILHKFGRQGVPTKEEIKGGFPYKYESNSIQGVLTKGMLFKVVKVTYMNNFETRQIYYAAEILSDGPFKGKIVDVSLLTDGSEVPKFLEKYAVEVKQ